MAENNYQKERNLVVKNTTNFQEMQLDKMKNGFPRYLKKRKKEFVEAYDKYVRDHSSDDGFFIPDEYQLPFFTVSEHAFKPIIKIAGSSPTYSADEMAIGFDYFRYCIEKINEKTVYPPITEDFCRLMNISKDTFNSYKNNSSDERMCEVCKMIQDYCYSTSVRASLNGKAEKLTTMYMNKVSNDKRDNTPVNNNTFIQNATIMSDSELDALQNKFVYIENTNQN